MTIESVNEAPLATPAAADDTEALLAEVYKAESPTEVSEKPATPAPTETPKMWRIKRGEMEVEKPENEVLALAQKGFDYELNNRLLRTERELLESQKAKYKPFEEIDPERFKTLKTLDDYAAKNPKFLELVQSEWQKFQSGTAAGETANPLLEKLSTLEKTVSELTEERKSFKTQQEDQVLDKELKELRGKYTDFNWNLADDNGFTNEHKVLTQMANTGMSARAAFFELFGDKLMEQTISKVKEQTAKEIQDRQKRGYLINNKLNASNSFQTPATRNVAAASYDDLAADVIKNLNLG